MLLGALDWGAHHFPEGCLIEHTRYERLIREVREKYEISERLNLQFENLVKLYECYFEFKSSGEAMFGSGGFCTCLVRADSGERVFYVVYVSENLLNALMLENGRKNDKKYI